MWKEVFLLCFDIRVPSSLEAVNSRSDGERFEPGTSLMQEVLQELSVSENSVVRDWTLSNSEFAHFEYLPEAFRKNF
jgi:hypothetical protein